MSTNPQWEEVPVPRGAFIGWGNAIGQFVTGKVLDYGETGGTDFNGNTCPTLSVELLESAASFDKNGSRTDFPAGDLVILNAGQVSLKRALRAAALNPGDLVKITMGNLVKSDKGTVKEFEIKVARGAGRAAQPAQTFQQQPPAQQAPAFQQAPAQFQQAPAPAQFQQAPAQFQQAPAQFQQAPAAAPAPPTPEQIASLRAAGIDPATVFPGYVAA